MQASFFGSQIVLESKNAAAPWVLLAEGDGGREGLLSRDTVVSRLGGCRSLSFLGNVGAGCGSNSRCIREARNSPPVPSSRHCVEDPSIEADGEFAADFTGSGKRLDRYSVVSSIG